LLARLLAQLDEHDFPVPMGVFRCVEQPLYGEMMTGQVSLAQEISWRTCTAVTPGR
jgi:hypothetical protein